MMKRPAPNCSADGRQRLRTGGGQEARKGPTSPSQRFPRPECKPEKVERLVRKVAPAVRILAVDDLRLLRVQHQLAGREVILQRTPQRPRLFGALAVTNGIVRVPLERNVRIGSRHPRVERIVQEQVCKERADDPTLRRSCCARHDTAVLHLHRSLQPALDVEQHPPTVRMMPDRLKQPLPIDAVEIGLYVRYRAPSHTASSADERGARHRSPIDRACSRMRRRETQLPDTAPGTDGRPPERCDPRPSECPTGACHRLPSEYRPAAPAEENSSPTTAGSTACRGCSKDQPRSLRSTVGLLQPLPGWPSHI